MLTWSSNQKNLLQVQAFDRTCQDTKKGSKSTAMTVTICSLKRHKGCQKKKAAGYIKDLNTELAIYIHSTVALSMKHSL